MGGLPKQTKRADLIRGLRQLGFDGPFVGRGDHPEFMQRGDRLVKLPNTHRGDVGQHLLKMVLEQAGVTTDEWTTRR